MDTFPRGAAEFVMSKWAPPALHRFAHESRQPPYWMLVVKPIENYVMREGIHFSLLCKISNYSTEERKRSLEFRNYYVTVNMEMEKGFLVLGIDLYSS